MLIKLSYGRSGHFLLYGDYPSTTLHRRNMYKRERGTYTISFSMSENRINLLPRHKPPRNNPIPRHILPTLNCPRRRRNSRRTPNLSIFNFSNPRIDTPPFTPETREHGFHEFFLWDNRELHIPCSEGTVIASLNHSLGVRVS